MLHLHISIGGGKQTYRLTLSGTYRSICVPIILMNGPYEKVNPYLWGNLRYFFGQPVIWSVEISGMLSGCVLRIQLSFLLFLASLILDYSKVLPYLSYSLSYTFLTLTDWLKLWAKLRMIETNCSITHSSRLAHLCINIYNSIMSSSLCCSSAKYQHLFAILFLPMSPVHSTGWLLSVHFHPHGWHLGKC